MIPGPLAVQRGCEARGLPFLLNTSATIPVGNARLILGGLPWTSHADPRLSTLVPSLYPERQAGDVRLLLIHHPILFDIAGDSDLVLAGHTHGGQIMATDHLGLGPLFFKYWSGLYRRGPSSLVVSNGCGDWFPCRVGAPAEIGLLRLVRAA